MVTVARAGVQVVSGLTGLVLLNSTASEFHGFPQDRYTTLPETTDRILATAVDAKLAAPARPDRLGRTRSPGVLGRADRRLREHVQLLAAADPVLDGRAGAATPGPEIAEVRLALPNKHHYLVDLAPFGLTNDNEVFIAGDRPYGLIEGTVTRDDVPPAGAEWYL